MTTSHRNSERGQILILIALAIAGLIGFTALAIDVSIVYDERRSAQNAADSAAMAGALTLIKGGDVETASMNAALAAGYDNNGTTNWVEVHHPPIHGEYQGNSQYVQVIIRNQTQPSLAQVVFSGDFLNEVEAIARAKPQEYAPIYGDYAIVVLNPTEKNAFNIAGIADLEVISGGIFDNSNHNCAFGANGNIKLDVDHGVFVVGKECLKGNIHLDPPNMFHTGVPPITIEDPKVPPPTQPSAPTCVGNGSRSGTTYYPGNFEKIEITGNGTYAFNPGSYCLNKRFYASGNLTFNGDNLAFYIGNGNFDMNGNIKFTGNNLLFYVADGDFAINGNIEFTGNNVTIFVQKSIQFNGNFDLKLTGDNTFFYVNTGSLGINGNTNAKILTTNTLFYIKEGSFNVNGNQSLTANGVTFYMENGDFTWNGNSDLHLTAPTEGPYKNLLVYLPEGNSGKVTINGNSGVQTIGTILAPKSHVKLTGNAGILHRSQIICDTMSITGNFDGTINYNGEENWQVLSGPFIELPH